MRSIVFIGALAFLLSATGASAQTPASCPWLSLGSAEVALDGPVSAKLQVDEKGLGTCEFIRQAGSNEKTLRVVVSKTDLHECAPDAVKVPALGNEAFQCNRKTSRGDNVDEISGRVRDRFFAVTITAVPGAARVPSDPDHLRDPYAASLLERVAEQVAGNLF